MTVTLGVDGFLVIIACILFLIAAIMAWVGHRLALSMIAIGLLLWALTAVVH